MTAVLSANSRHVIRRNAAMLPAYSIVLGLLALMGYMALAAGVAKNPLYADGFKQFGSTFAVPALLMASFPDWFTGVAFAAIGIGALVPAAVMSIACANLFTRNIYKEMIRPECSDAEESRMAKIVSLIVKIGALVFIILLPLQYAIQLQLLGGIWIIQTLPAVIFGLYTRWFDPRALLAGWAAGIATGSWMAGTLAFKASVFPLSVFGYTLPGYAALYSLIVNIAVATVMSLVLNAAGGERRDETAIADYR
jgi:SSS family solute:Na+ symporter